ncbi:bifunctional 4-hydroxy-2-oxoglutarate aldolase/2-dehydro-3-deoxy-phosphogluconate aldolase [Echinimonas agarilytica]|uniref:Bifunctional 4-hydroxy-2-oxoglutarate aldolase/2-dehydro-3-deoxy-phosphogluconate aldolase n=1 Tax=Echinimonas agarilytica TaxID=1215918 RepID=A0AA41W8A8_9GAMM|nr:bifunctional 4-hydroxy-2-oxoglutarate aldolase/2-dehydro-3-deoxy-phosphogluconate aldolase [Echinimonas agarilytica]MCM2680701.1 bifunctional 4-hydroxy-2-oxoglutarate aldolase/2-dehydro-3-deoxy-phosphogluconate aldolase [Echinimonas agarilytica]
MKRFSELMAGQTLLPIIQADSVEQGILIAKAMANAELKVVEVVLRSESSLETLTAIKEELPELVVGAGTVLDKHILAEALLAKPDYIVTPCCTPDLLRALVDSNVVALPGVANCADIALARDAGFPELKLFPASLAGGIPFLKAVSSVFQDTSFCPTGGINADNKNDFLALPNVVAVGGTWVAKKEWVEAENWEAITQACCAANL